MAGDQPESQASKSLQPENPFSTRAVRPGALDYRFPPGDSLANLISRLRENHWLGEIVGPHGSGKSTLIQTLRPALLDAGRIVHQFTLTRGERRLPVAIGDITSWDDQTQLVIDGFEQLSWWRRRSLRRVCRRQGCGLLITAHVSFGFPRILTAATSLELTEHLVAALLSGPAADKIPSAEIEGSFSRHQGNVREVFFDLYDRYEQRVRG